MVPPAANDAPVGTPTAPSLPVTSKSLAEAAELQGREYQPFGVKRKYIRKSKFVDKENIDISNSSPAKKVASARIGIGPTPAVQVSPSPTQMAKQNAQSRNTYLGRTLW